MFQKKVPLDYTNINKLIEGQKIYLFTSLKYSKDLNDCFHLTPKESSLVKLIDVSSILYNNILVNNLNIVSFKGKIKKFNIETNEIEITDENGQNIIALLTNRLFKKIELGSDCFFNCFIKKINGDKKEFLSPTEFSDIFVEDKTKLIFNFIKGSRYYNQIIIDNIVKNISNEDEKEVDVKVYETGKSIVKKILK